MKLKKIFGAILAMAAVFTVILGITAFADNVCYIGEEEAGRTYYTTIDEAIRAGEGKTVRVMANTTWTRGSTAYVVNTTITSADEENPVTVTMTNAFNATGGTINFRNITVDLGNAVCFHISGATINLQAGASVINGRGDWGCISIGDWGGKSVFTMEAGSLVTGSSSYSGTGHGAVVTLYNDNNTFNFNGGTIKNYDADGNHWAVSTMKTTNKINISGNATIEAGTGGPSDTTGANNAIKLMSADQLKLSGAFTGSLSINSEGFTGSAFGTCEEGASGFDKLACYGNAEASCVNESNVLSWEERYNLYVGTDTEGNRYMNLTDAVLKSNNRTNQNIFLTADADWTTEVNAYTGIQNGYYTIDGGGHTVTLKKSIGIGIGARVILKNITVDMDGNRFLLRDESHLELGAGATLTGGNSAQGAISIEGNANSCFTMQPGSKITSCGKSATVSGVIYVHDAGKLIFNGGAIETANTSVTAILLRTKSSAVSVTGGFKMIPGVTGARCDLSVQGENQLKLSGAFTGSLTVNAAEAGKPFGTYEEGASGFDKLACYGNAEASCVNEDGKLIWATEGDCYIGTDKYGKLSLEAAIKKAPAGSVIHLLNNIELESTVLMDRRDVTLTVDGSDGEGGMFKVTIKIPDEQTLSTADKRILLIRNGHIILNNVILDGGMHKDYGGSVIVEELSCSLTLKGTSVIKGGRAVNGGAVWVRKGTLNLLENAEIRENSAQSNGGAIYLTTDGVVNLEGGKITANYAPGGGGIWADAGTKLYLKGGALVYDNTNNTQTNAQSNIIPANDKVIILKNDFSGKAGVSFGKMGASFGVYESGKGEGAFLLDGGGAFGHIKEGKLIWAPGKIRISMEADSGVYTEEGEAKEGVIRFITNFLLAEDAEISSYGTYVFATDIFDANKNDVYTSTEKTLEAYFLSKTDKDAGFVTPVTGDSFGVDYIKIPKEHLDTAFTAVTFVNVGGTYFFCELSGITVNSIKNGADGKVKVLN